MKCKKCEIEKILDEFPKLRRVCKVCHASIHRILDREKRDECYRSNTTSI